MLLRFSGPLSLSPNGNFALFSRFFLVFLVYILSIRTQILHFTNNLRFNVILSFLMSFTLRTCTSIGEITQLFTNNLKNRLELKHKAGKKNFSKKKNFFFYRYVFFLSFRHNKMNELNIVKNLEFLIRLVNYFLTEKFINIPFWRFDFYIRPDRIQSTFDAILEISVRRKKT